MHMKILKNKWFWIALIGVLVLGGVVYGKIKSANQGPEYEFTNVEKGTLVQTVDATGIVQSADHLDLHFETGGTVEYIGVKEGDEVKINKLLANLRLSNLNAVVSQAQANLNQQLAGSTDEEIRYYESAVAVAKAGLDKSKTDKDSAVSSAQSALETAENNLDLAEGGENSEIVEDSYQDAVALLYSTLTVLDNALTQSDNILGVDNTLANDDFEDYLSVLDSSALSKANSDYLSAKLKRNEVKTKVLSLNTLSTHEEIDVVLIDLEDALSTMSNLLSSVSTVLSATPPVGDLTQTALNTKKTTVETTRTTVATSYTSIVNQVQAISTAKNSYITYNIAYEKAKRDLQNTTSQYQSLIDIKKASYDQSKANLDKFKADPREVDLAYYRASLSQAFASRNKAMIHAPIDGIITKINKKRGELAMSSEIMIEMLSPHFEIEVDIPETDIVKLVLGDQVEITLDAFGDDEKFPGSVVSIDPASTNIQDVVYYKVKVALDNGKDEVRSGMTANVLISTEEKVDTLYLPFRAVLSRNGSGVRYVRVIENGELKEVDVKIGLRGDDGILEITEGVEVGQEVVLKVIED